MIHNRGEVSEENIEKVNTIIKELGYKPNIFARNLALNKQYNFAVLLPDVELQEYWKAAVNGVDKAEDELSAFGVSVTKYFFDPYNPESFREQANKILLSVPDGLAVSPILNDDFQEFVMECNALKIPFIFIDTNISTYKPLSSVGQDARASGYMAARLLSYGSTDGAFLILTIAKKIDNHSHFSERIKGFKHYFAEHLTSESTIQELTGLDDLNLDAKLNEAFSSKKVKGVFVPNSRVHKIAAYLKKNDIQKIRLIGYDLIEKNCEYLQNGFIDFLINQKPEEQGHQAIRLLHNSIVLKQSIDLMYQMPLNIVVKENLTNF
ncbi:MAG: LacI family DNA-binding transcriptional regulator [Cytophagales bacterium]|nr:LacI family DNA-binding transcriptional regulator [Cytophaga sp.]